MTQPTFDFSVRYPVGAGFKEPTTSKEAASKVDAQRLQGLVIGCLQQHGSLTADECAERLQLSILSIRPRFSELLKQQRIGETGTTRTNRSGHSAKVWKLGDQ